MRQIKYFLTIFAVLLAVFTSACDISDNGPEYGTTLRPSEDPGRGMYTNYQNVIGFHEL